MVGATFPVRWRGMNAAYTASERELMRDLPVREQALVHTLKSLTGGEIAAPYHETSGAGNGESRAAEVGVTPDEGLRVATVASSGSRVYTDPEDLEFGRPSSGAPKKTRPIYALVWTWRKSKIYKLKKDADRQQKVWKRWYERQGWKVYRMQGAFHANGPNGERHCIALHEYDRETKERLK